jgi:hypothetical protein
MHFIYLLRKLVYYAFKALNKSKAHCEFSGYI